MTHPDVCGDVKDKQKKSYRASFEIHVKNQNPEKKKAHRTTLTGHLNAISVGKRFSPPHQFLESDRRFDREK